MKLRGAHLATCTKRLQVPSLPRLISVFSSICAPPLLCWRGLLVPSCHARLAGCPFAYTPSPYRGARTSHAVGDRASASLCLPLGAAKRSKSMWCGSVEFCTKERPSTFTSRAPVRDFAGRHSSNLPRNVIAKERVGWDGVGVRERRGGKTKGAFICFVFGGATRRGRILPSADHYARHTKSTDA